MYTPRILTGGEDLDTIRQLLLPQVALATVQRRLSDTVILAPPILPRAETMVIQRIPDWALIAQEQPTSITYAGGDLVSAKYLLFDAAMSLTCMLLCPQLRQLVAKEERTEFASIVRDINWTAEQQRYKEQGQAALGYLLPTVTPPALQMGIAQVAPSDPDANPTELLPVFGITNINPVSP